MSKLRYPLGLHALLSCPRVNVRFEGEDAIAYEVANFLRAESMTGSLKAVWWHTPNEGKRSKLAGAIAKALGLIPGAPDLVFLGDGKVGCIELKQPKNYQNSNQRSFDEWCRWHEVPYMVCHSLAEVQATLRAWGML